MKFLLVCGDSHEPEIYHQVCEKHVFLSHGVEIIHMSFWLYAASLTAMMDSHSFTDRNTDTILSFNERTMLLER